MCCDQIVTAPSRVPQCVQSGCLRGKSIRPSRSSSISLPHLSLWCPLCRYEQQGHRGRPLRQTVRILCRTLGYLRVFRRLFVSRIHALARLLSNHAVSSEWFFICEGGHWLTNETSLCDYFFCLVCNPSVPTARRTHFISDKFAGCAFRAVFLGVVLLL